MGKSVFVKSDYVSGIRVLTDIILVHVQRTSGSVSFRGPIEQRPKFKPCLVPKLDANSDCDENLKYIANLKFRLFRAYQ